METLHRGDGTPPRVGILGAGRAFRRMLPGLRKWFTIGILSQNYWDLVAEGFHSYFSSRPATPHGYNEGRAALETILEAKMSS